MEDKTPAELTFTCPQCGASTAYDPSAASVACAHCGYVHKIEAQVVGAQAKASEFTLDTLQQQQRGWGQERRELHCDSCGADLSLAPTDLSVTCPFCGSNEVITRPAIQEMLRPEFLIPFKQDREGCRELARAWLGKGWMHPSGLVNAAASTQFQGIYLPFWTFSTQIQSNWDAEVGHERTEQYYDSGSKTWHSRIVIDWRWESGQVGLPIRNLLMKGTQNVSKILIEKIYPFNLKELAEYQPEFLAGWQAKAYDIPLQTAWDDAKANMREQAKRACEKDINSAHVRNFSMKADFEEETWRLVLLPIYLAAYRFQNKAYQIMINGQSGKVAGQKPVAWRKVWLATALLLAPSLILAAAGMIVNSTGGDGSIPVTLGVFLFLIGLIASAIIVNQAMKAGEA